MKNKNTILKAIDYLSIYAAKSEKFEDFKFISRSIDNPLQVSFISKKKIDSMLEHTGKKIIGTPEQRKKYFTSTSIQKLLQQMFTDQAQRTENISFDIDKQLRKDFTGNAEFFISDDVKGFYSRENKELIYNNNGSCMEGKPSNYFEIYDNFINIKTQIVGLKVGKSVIARAMLWSKGTEEKKYFLDRIYIGNEFKNSNEEQLQLKLHSLVKRMLRIKTLDCYSSYHINKHIESLTDGLPKRKFNIGDSTPSFTIQIDTDTFQELECYPYADTFRFGSELSNNVKFSDDEDSCDYILDNTDGYYSEGNGCFCESCEERVSEDYGSYSEVESEFLCEDCSVYLEDREDVCRESNTIYDSYREVYCYDGDF
tara:strand:+ start:1848 stop:2954 length:1107 start_codon:yes stop_codon:yes gene_type:complete